MIKIRELRKIHNLTAKQLGNLINVAESTISLYENGKRSPNYDTLFKLADFFEVSIGYLLGKENIISPETQLTENNIKVALFGGDEKVTDEMWDEVKNFIEFIKQKNNK